MDINKNRKQLNIKIFLRNVWLISMLVFVILFLFNLLSNFLFKFNIFNVITSVIFWSIIAIGVLSFLGWVFLLIFRSRISKIIAVIIIFVSSYLIYGWVLISQINGNINYFGGQFDEYVELTSQIAEGKKFVCDDAGNIDNILPKFKAQDKLLEEMSKTNAKVAKDIVLAEKIVILNESKDNRATLFRRFRQINQKQIDIENRLKLPINQIDRIPMEYYCKSFIKVDQIVMNFYDSYFVKNDDFSLDDYIDTFSKENDRLNEYKNVFIPILDEIYKTVTDHKYDYRVYVTKEVDYYVHWENLLKSIISDDKDFNNNYLKIVEESSWLENSWEVYKEELLNEYHNNQLKIKESSEWIIIYKSELFHGTRSNFILNNLIF